MGSKKLRLVMLLKSYSITLEMVDFCRCEKPSPSVFVNRCLDCGEAIQGDPLLAAATNDQLQSSPLNTIYQETK